MRTFSLTDSLPTGPRILCLGAHSDDIEIGCGGTMLKLLEQYPQAAVTWVVFSAEGRRKDEALLSADLFLKCAKEKKVVALSFRDGFFPYVGWEIKEYFETLKEEKPDLIFTHFRQDLHQDHRQICELTWNTFRDHLILEYEIPKYDGDLSTPNFFVPLDEEVCKRKVAYLASAFNSQGEKPWFTEETFFATLRMRGVESRSPSRYA